jgi:hypothetical protein
VAPRRSRTTTPRRRTCERLHFAHRQRPVEVRAHVVKGPLDRWNDVAQAAEVEDQRGAFEVHAVWLERGHVHLHHLAPAVAGVVLQVVEPPGDQVVDDRNVVAAVDQQVNGMAPDKAGSAGDDRFHLHIWVHAVVVPATARRRPG